MEGGIGLKSSGAKPFFYDHAEVDAALKIKEASMAELIDLLVRNGFEDVEIRRLPGLTHPEFDYQTWYVFLGTKPVFQRHIEELGISDFWDNAAAEYEANHELAEKSVCQEVLAGFIGEDKEIRILDVATGTGMIANRLGAHGYTNVTCADISEGMMRIAMQHAKEQSIDVHYKYGNASSSRTDTNVSAYPFANANRRQIAEIFKKAGFKDVSVNHLYEKITSIFCMLFFLSFGLFTYLYSFNGFCYCKLVFALQHDLIKGFTVKRAFSADDLRHFCLIRTINTLLL